MISPWESANDNWWRSIRSIPKWNPYKNKNNIQFKHKFSFAHRLNLDKTGKCFLSLQCLACWTIFFFDHLEFPNFLALFDVFLLFFLVRCCRIANRFIAPNTNLYSSVQRKFIYSGEISKVSSLTFRSVSTKNQVSVGWICCVLRTFNVGGVTGII